MHTQSSKLRRWSLFVASLATAAFLMQGCGGGDDGASGPAGTAGATGPAGPAGKDLTAKVDASTLPADQWEVLAPKGEVTKVTISSPPVVEFKVTDALGNPIVGLGNTSKSSTATVAGYTNVAFALAKLVPGTDGGPSKWVSYIVTTVPTTTAAVTGSRPTTDNTGTLVDNGDGSYKYTFYRDITKVRDTVAALTLTAPNVAADLGDLTYEPTRTHRLVIQVSGAARGTGSNTANAATVTPAVNILNPANIIYDFIPATGKAVAATDLQRELVSISNCNECHEKLAFHGGGARIDTKFCVVCHTEQRKYGYANVASVAGSFPGLKETATVNATTGITSYSYSPETRVADGEVSGNFTTMIHKIHNGNALVKTNYNYANVAFNNKGYSMLDNGQRMCTKCHDNTKVAQADNWNVVPTRLACGACHDGINFATGTGTTIAGAATGHVGRAQSSDKTCALCHAPADIKVYHQTVNVTPHNPTVTAGLKNFTYEIKEAKVNATTNDVTIEFKISADGTPVTLKTPAAGLTTSLDGFTGGPSFLLAYAMPQDGITTPADYNNAGVKQAQALSVSLADLLNTSKATLGSVSGPVSGYYTATIKGDGPTSCGGTAPNGTPVKCVFPVGAKMRAVAMNAYYTQVSPAAARHTVSVVKAVTGDTARRTVVDPAKCANCHEWFEGHGGSRVYQTQVCVVCHVPGMPTSGRGIADSIMTTYAFSAADIKKLTDWGFDKTLPNAALKFPVTTNNFKDMIHGIHAGRERVTPFADARDRTPSAITLLDMRRMDFPGKLNNCNTCHVTSTSAATTFNTVPANTLASTYEAIDAAYDAAIATGTATPALAKTALKTANATDIVTTPFAAACVSCHDAAAAKAHITLNGGQIQVKRSALALAGESCKVCHGSGAEFDPVKVHQ